MSRIYEKISSDFFFLFFHSDILKEEEKENKVASTLKVKEKLEPVK
jgi:hypothetical protein